MYCKITRGNAMEIAEIKKEIADIDAHNQYGRDGSSLVVIRDRCPKGRRIRTALGLHDINNIQLMENGKYQICFHVKRSQFVKYLNNNKQE